MRYLTLLFSTALLFLSGCIKNDIPYPIVSLDILNVQGEGFTVEHIDQATQTVTLVLNEETNIRAVNISSVTLTEGATTSIPLTGSFDLRTPIYVTLTLYQDYKWIIRAKQTIERRITVEGQIGAVEIDETKHAATVRVAKGTDLTSLSMSELKLGPANITTYSPSIEELSGSNFESVRFVDVITHGTTDRWMLYVLPTDTNVSITQADVWSKVIWLYGAGISGSKTMGFYYRQTGETGWQTAPNVKIEGGSFSVRLSVEANTSYEVKAFCEEEETNIKTYQTQNTWQLPNSGFEEWSAPEGSRKHWLPYFLDTPFWDTGNKGATTLGEAYNLTIPVDDPRPGSIGAKAAKLSTRWVVLKLAAGNLFVGEYFATNGTNGVVGFGQKCGYRPTALHGWVKFKGGKINRIGTVPPGVEIIKDVTPENGMIYVALGTWTPEEYGTEVEGKFYGNANTPIAINTKDLTTFFDPKGKDVIAYGEKVMVDDMDTWTEFTIPITYKATNLVPTHIVVVCSASRYGDYFTGYDKSVVWVDDFELMYE